VTETDYASAVALVGMSGRFPGAPDLAALWRNLLAGVKGLRELTDEELRAAGADPGRLADPRYVRIGGPLDGIDQFDAAVFGINPREAESMDPQHRLFLECSWEALESAGYCPTDVPGRTAVIAGCGFPDYIVQNIQHLYAEPGGVLLVAVGNERDSLASMVSYKLGLRGPSLSVQTFCSTSAVAVHLACQSLLTYECDIAVAGGAFIPLPQPAGYLYEPGGIASPDGKARSFDAEANGTVMGSGVGAVSLKRMSEALADGDVIHAVILGSAVNNDGRMRAGYTAPGVDGQSEVIDLALSVAGVKPETIGYVECHATGTVLGDAIELAAMNRVFNQPRETPCVLGTLKPSLGHLDRASGVAGLMRAALNLKHGVLPATPDFKTPNPALATALDRFTVLTESRRWPEGPNPRRAGVSSFGLGGTNVHVVLEQAPARAARPARPGPHLLTFSASNEAALTAIGERLAWYLEEHQDVDLADVAHTLQVSRGGFALRRAVVCLDREDAVRALATPARWIDGKTTRRNPAVRLSVPQADVPADWWPDLRAALRRLGAPATAPTAAADPAGVVAASVVGEVGDWLAGLGIHVLRDTDAGGSAAANAQDIAVAPDPQAAPAPESAAAWLLATVARLWQAGATPDWPKLHGGQGRRLELPTYPFQRRRYWVNPKPRKASGDTDAFWAPSEGPAGRTFDRSQWTYLPTWQPAPSQVADLADRLRAAGPWLVLAADERGEALAAALDRAGAPVTVARPGADYQRGENGFTVRPDAAEDLARMLDEIPAPPRAVVHGFSLGTPPADGDPAQHFTAAQDCGFHSAMALAKALTDETGTAPRAELVLLTSGAAGVAGSDLRHPEHATLAAIGPSLAQENPRVHCRSIDVDEVPAGELGLLAEGVLAAAVSPHAGPVAVRGGETWLRRYQPFPTEEPAQGQGPFRRGDTVLITGGLGDVGLVLARHLAAKYECRLVLTGRSPLPPREEWDGYLAAVPAGGARTARHIRNVLDLEERGAEVLALSADSTDADAMRAAVQAAVGRFGRIDVAVHAAGLQTAAYFDYAHRIGRSAGDAHFAVKVKGFLVLQDALGEQAPDRRVAVSSLAAILGGITLSAYAAANAALDAYVRVARRSGAGRWITVDWDTWRIEEERLEGHGPGVTDFAMAPSEAVDVFERTLAAGDRTGHLVISTGPLAARIEQWVVADLHEADQAAEERELHPRPELGTPFAEPREGTETVLAEIWSRVLGIAPVGIDDDFFELGGHSLIAINLTARIRRTLGAAIPITVLLDGPTIRQVAALIDAGDPKEAGGGADDTAEPADTAPAAAAGPVGGPHDSAN
jgi:acyl transferase domain-containing protein